MYVCVSVYVCVCVCVYECVCVCVSVCECGHMKMKGSPIVVCLVEIHCCLNPSHCHHGLPAAAAAVYLVVSCAAAVIAAAAPS